MLEPVNTFDYEKNKTEIIYTIDAGTSRYKSESKFLIGPKAKSKSKSKSKSDSESDSESEGMTNHAEASCWLTSVVQSIRASKAFKKEYAPKAGEKGSIKKELFKLFDIAEGTNGQKRRAVRSGEIKSFKRMLIDKGLPAKMDDGFHQGTFLKFLLKQIKSPGIEYQEGSKNKKEQMLGIKFSESTKKKSLQSIIKESKIAFTAKDKVPKFLPVFVDRPRPKNSKGKREYSRAAIDPTTPLSIPVLTNGENAKYKLVSVVICTPYWHAYTYVIEKAGWVLYDDDRVTVLKSPEKKYRDLDFSPYEDACKHSAIYIYEAI
jgi:hypothetical protein